MMVTLRMKNSCFFYKRNNLSCILCKIISQSKLNCQRLSLSPDLCTAAYSNNKSDVSKYFKEDSKRREKISQNEVDADRLSENIYIKGKERSQYKLTSHTNVENNITSEEADFSQSKENIELLKFSLSNKQSDEDQLFAKNYSEKKDVSKINFKPSLSDITEKQKGETLLTMEATPNDLEDATNLARPNKLPLWAFSPDYAVADDVKMKVLKEMLYDSREHKLNIILPIFFKHFYKLENNLMKENTDLENIAKSQVQTFLLPANINYHVLCRIIRDYGKAVGRGSTILDRRFVDDIYNTICASKAENVSVHALNFFVNGVQTIRYINHNCFIYLENYLKKIFNVVERDKIFFYRYLNVLANYDFPSRGEQWPFLKILLENPSPHINKISFDYSITNAIKDLTLESLLLISMGLYSNARLAKLSEIIENEKSFVASDHNYCEMLLLNEAVGDQFLRENGRPLFSEKILQALKEQRHKTLRDDPVQLSRLKERERYKTCLEEAVGVKDSVLLISNSIIEGNAHLIMVFDDKNQPYCLQEFSKEETTIEDLSFPVNSKIVVVKFLESSHYFECSDGCRILGAFERLKIRLYENLGFQVVNLEKETFSCLDDSLLGNHIYDQIKKTIEGGSVDFVQKKDISKMKFKHSLSDITEIQKEETLLTMEALQNDLNLATKSARPNKGLPKILRSWAFSPSAADDEKIMVLEEILSESSGNKVTSNWSNIIKFFKIFYSLSLDSIRGNIHLENAAKTQVQTGLLLAPTNYNALCCIIYTYGKAVASGLTMLDRRFVGDIYNTICASKQKNLSLTTFSFFFVGVRKIRYMNHNLLIYLESYLINNFKEVEQNDSIFISYLNTLSNYDFPSRGDQWPLLKILLENARPDTIADIHRNSNESSLKSSILQSLFLISMGLFPKARLHRIFELARNEKSMVALNSNCRWILLLNAAVGDQYFRESGRPLFSEEIVQAVVENRRRTFLRSNPILERCKTCLEEAVGLKDSVLVISNSKIEMLPYLTMVFDDKNKPYCLEKFSNEETTIEDLNFPNHSKMVVVRFVRSKYYYYKRSDGTKILNGIERLITRLYENLGFHVVNLHGDEVLQISNDSLLGIYIYDQIKKTIEQSSVD